MKKKCHFPFGENVKDFQCVRKEMKKKSNQIKEKLTKNKKNNKDGKSVKLEESKTTITEDSLSFT